MVRRGSRRFLELCPRPLSDCARQKRREGLRATLCPGRVNLHCADTFAPPPRAHAPRSRSPLHVVAGRLGDDPKTVLATYAHLLPHSDAEAAQVVAAALVDKSLTNGPIPSHAS